jgi:hypothetical protein
MKTLPTRNIQIQKQVRRALAKAAAARPGASIERAANKSSAKKKGNQRAKRGK